VTYGKHSLRYLGTSLWGKLSPDVRSAKILNTFNNKIRKCDISSLVDDECKRCVSSSRHNYVILSFFVSTFSDYYSVIRLSD